MDPDVVGLKMVLSREGVTGATGVNRRGGKAVVEQDFGIIALTAFE